MRPQSSRIAVARAAVPSSRTSTQSPAMRRATRQNSAMSSARASRPFSPWRINSPAAAWSQATTARPLAMASGTTLP
jgi:hypothetical protein